MTLVERLFGTHSERELKIIQKTVDKIVALRGSMQELSDEELRAKTDEFKQRLANGETLDDILVEAFAVVREGAKRSIGLEPYPVQLIGGIVAHQGRIAEMRTGEGKSLTCALPSYLNALEGKGVHVVTVNDYLAKRDADEMGQLHRFLGLTVSCITHDMTPDQRKAAYNADITYVTNNELGFDYLRDNMAIHKTQLVQRGLHYAIIDEIDSILIDEARTPLIISGQGNTSTQLYILCDTLATQLEKGTFQGELNKLDILLGDVIEEDGDYIVDEKDKVVTLTERGVHKVEKFFGIDNLADIENIEIQHNMELALRANNLMLRDRDYIVTDDGEVQIVDEFTGRVMPGRRFSDGLHQAIEAKERVKIKSESRTLATITFQNFFNKYDKKSGMTGTALTEEREFRDIYGLDVIVIPTNRPIKRVDHNDAVYKTQREKYNAILNDVRECYRRKQPVLVGTANIEVSELLSNMFRRAGIPHEVLNAKNHAKEAEIVAKAGQKGAVTIATNMAGRGTDIKLGEGVAELGGLKIIGSERHESRRIDNQLRGRSGRQGDHGESKFYISLEDDLMRLFSSENAIKMLESLGVPDGEEIQHKILTGAIEKAQKKVEGNNYAIRKRLIDYDIINNEQRELIYKERMQVLDGQDMKETIINMMTDMLEVAIDENIVDGKNKNGWNTEGLEVEINRIIPLGHIDISSYSSKNEISEAISDMAIKFYDEREKDFGDPEAMRGFERFLLLKVIDAKWIEHIDNMEHLRMGIGLQAYAQKDPVVEYKTQAYDMFNEMSHNIKYDTVRKVFQTRVERVEKV